MKIAFASEGKMVTEHFRHCESFNIFEVENNMIIDIIFTYFLERNKFKLVIDICRKRIII